MKASLRNICKEAGVTTGALKLFFKDKGMFFTSLITPVILLVLYATFLAKVYRDSFAAAMPALRAAETPLCR